MAGGTVSSMTLFSFTHFSTTVPPLSIHKEPDEIGRYMKELKTSSPVADKDALSALRNGGLISKRWKKGPITEFLPWSARHKKLHWSQEPYRQTHRQWTRTLSAVKMTWEVFEMGHSFLKTKWKSLHAWEKKKMRITKASPYTPAKLQRAIVLEAWIGPLDAPGD